MVFIISVSVIIPVFNSYPYLRDAISSVVNQTLDDIEIIIVDDSSFDGSSEIIFEYFDRYPEKIRVIRNEVNRGVGYSRNIGMRNARGRYITFLDSDDYVNMRMYEDMYREACRCNFPQVVSSGIVFVRDNSYLNRSFDFARRDKGCVYDILDDPQVILDMSPSSCNKLFRRDVISSYSFLENTMWEDVAFTYSVLFNCNNILVMNNSDYFYRKSMSQGLSSRSFRVCDDIFDCFKVCDDIDLNTKKTSSYDKFSLYIRFVQISFCLQRCGEVLKWDMDFYDKEMIIYQIVDMVNNRYGSIFDYSRDILSSKVGIVELDRILDIYNKYSLDRRNR